MARPAYYCGFGGESFWIVRYGRQFLFGAGAVDLPTCGPVMIVTTAPVVRIHVDPDLAGAGEACGQLAGQAAGAG